jgi:N-acetylmuramic acid 6-phosphate etherase
MNCEDRSVPAAVGKAGNQIKRGVGLIVQSLQGGGRLFFIGAGTSGRLGVIEAAECPPTFNTPPALVQAVMAGGKSSVFRSKEGAEDRREEGFDCVRRKMTRKDVLVGIAASGVTPYVAGGLAAAQSKGAKTVLIACNASTPLKNAADCVIALRVGPEVIAGSTRLKAGTATKLVLNMLTVTSMVRLGKVFGNRMVDLQPKSKKLTARALRLIQNLGEVSEKDARKYFTRAGKKVKAAILMARRRCDYGEASRLLRNHAGFLRKALEA